MFLRFVIIIIMLGLSPTTGAKVEFMPDAAEKSQPDFSKMSAVERNSYCEHNGYKLIVCSEPYMTHKYCPANSLYADKCICQLHYTLTCAETEGLRGKGPKCDGKYAQCCKFTCPNPVASLISCEERGLKEVHSEREDNECGQHCYVCQDTN